MHTDFVSSPADCSSASDHAHWVDFLFKPRKESRILIGVKTGFFCAYHPDDKTETAIETDQETIDIFPDFAYVTPSKVLRCAVSTEIAPSPPPSDLHTLPRVLWTIVFDYAMPRSLTVARILQALEWLFTHQLDVEECAAIGETTDSLQRIYPESQIEALRPVRQQDGTVALVAKIAFRHS